MLNKAKKRNVMRRSLESHRLRKIVKELRMGVEEFDALSAGAHWVEQRHEQPLFCLNFHQHDTFFSNTFKNIYEGSL